MTPLAIPAWSADGLENLLIADTGLAIIYAIFAVAARFGRPRRNPVAGVRTPATLSSDEAWRAGHRAAQPWFAAGAVVAAVAAGIGWYCLSVGAIDAGLVIAWVGLLVLVSLTIRMVIAANRAAAAEPRSSR